MLKFGSSAEIVMGRPARHFIVGFWFFFAHRHQDFEKKIQNKKNLGGRIIQNNDSNITPFRNIETEREFLCVCFATKIYPKIPYIITAQTHHMDLILARKQGY